MRKTTGTGRLDLKLEVNSSKKTFPADVANPIERNVRNKRTEKIQKYRQLAYEIRERPEYRIEVVLMIIGSRGIE